MTTTTTIHDIAAEFDRLSPSQVDTAIAGNGQQSAGHDAHEYDDAWPAVGWYCDGGNSGNRVVEIHPDDITKAAEVMGPLPDGAIDSGAIQDIEAAFSTAEIRCNWCY